jgi:hypothetical protein
MTLQEELGCRRFCEGAAALLWGKSVELIDPFGQTVLRLAL